MSRQDKDAVSAGAALSNALDRLGENIRDRNRRKIEAAARPGETHEQTAARLRQEADSDAGEGRAAPRTVKAANRRPPLAPDRQTQGDLFVADILDVMPKGEAASMEHPVFALRPGDKRIRSYEHNGNTLEVIPSGLGLATMHDKDVLLYCVGQVVEGMNRGRETSRTVRITAYDLLMVTNRGTGKTDYQRLRAALNRLRGTTLNTSIRTGGKVIDEGFGLIEDWRIEREDNTGRMVHIDITLSQWTYNAAVAMQVLTYNRDYFRLRGGLERRLYELARKHCGAQAKWAIGLDLLKKKAGSGGRLADFRNDIKGLERSDHLPDYRIQYDASDDLVTFYLRSDAGHRKQLADLLRTVTQAKDAKAKKGGTKARKAAR